MKEIIVGAHVSTAGGLYTACERASVLGVQSIQIFGSSPRAWRTKTPTEEECKKFKIEREKYSITHIYLHAAYLVNLASGNNDIFLNSKQSLIDHLSIAEMIGADGLIFHIGSSKGITREKALTQEIEAMKEIIERVPGKSKLIMENTAGGGDKVGDSIQEMGELYKKTHSKRLGVCFDTAHAFEAGWVEVYAKSSVKKLFDDFDKEIGIENLCAIHANDSMTEAGSHHDRHANIGEGKIGESGFHALFSDKRLLSIPWILEVPGGGNGPDKKNVEILRKLSQ
ncbi:MAG: deoxyribonuclease IV [Candidatus Paceibacterota bacterium]|jgi:deoxyribonuclease-4